MLECYLPVSDADFGLAEVGPAEVGPAEIGPAQVGPAEIGPAEVGPAEVGPAFGISNDWRQPLRQRIRRVVQSCKSGLKINHLFRHDDIIVRLNDGVIGGFPLIN